MNIKPIRNDDDLRAAFARLEVIFQAPEGSLEADEMEVLVALVEAYESKHYPVGLTAHGVSKARKLAILQRR